MKTEQFPDDIRDMIIPKAGGDIVYRCLSCGAEHPIDRLLYTCPVCGGILMLPDRDFNRLKAVPGATWRKIFDYRKMASHPALRGIFLFHEFIAPVIPTERVVYLGEGHTPLVEANDALRGQSGNVRFFFKNDGQNPSASFKDRGMACALSYINHMAHAGGLKNILAVCASTGDTSASAALYSAYLTGVVKSAVLLPHKKVTPQQLSQPLGSGARVFEIPGVFDDCMKVVEYLAEYYNVALLNSKNAWRIRGQESYSYEVCQWFDYEVADKTVVVPIGNAGNITAVMSGFLNFQKAGIIDALPKVIGVQSTHADPVYRYYLEPDEDKREWRPVAARPSVAQAAMIGNPVSMPRVISMVKEYNAAAGEKRVFFTEVTEQDIMDSQITANRNGHIICTQGGMSYAGFKAAVGRGIISKEETAVLDSTAHDIKFSGFRQMYNDNAFPAEYEITPYPGFVNNPEFTRPDTVDKVPEQGKPLDGDDLQRFVGETAKMIAGALDLEEK